MGSQDTSIGLRCASTPKTKCTQLSKFPHRNRILPRLALSRSFSRIAGCWPGSQSSKRLVCMSSIVENVFCRIMEEGQTWKKSFAGRQKGQSEFSRERNDQGLEGLVGALQQNELGKGVAGRQSNRQEWSQETGGSCRHHKWCSIQMRCTVCEVNANCWRMARGVDTQAGPDLEGLSMAANQLQLCPWSPTGPHFYSSSSWQWNGKAFQSLASERTA